MRVPRPIVVAVAVVLACVWHPAAGVAAGGSYAGEYQGTLSYDARFEGESGGPVFNRVHGSLTFSARFVTVVPASGGLPTTTGAISAQGGYDSSATNGRRVDTQHCGFSAPARPDFSSGFSAAPGSAGASLPAIARQLVVSTGTCSASPSTYLGLNACGTSGCTGVCEEDYARAKVGDFTRFQQAIDPVEHTYPKTGSRTTSYDVTLDPSGPCFSGTQTVRLSLRATLTLGGGGLATPVRRPPGRPRLTKEQRDAKLAALETLRDAWPKALTACSGTAAFATLFAAGPAGEAAAVILVPAEAYQCKAWLEVINSAADTFKDPPLPSDDVVARVAATTTPKLPACGTAGADLCGRTGAAALTAIAASRRTAAVAHAIDLTVSRESYAQAHRHRDAAARQDRALRGLNAQLVVARRKERAAGRALAGVLRGAGLTVTRDVAQAASQIDELLRRLALKGPSRAKLKTIDPALLAPRPGDWLAELAAA